MKLVDIAKATGTSLSMVSRVLNQNGYVKQEKKELITKELLKNGYTIRSQEIKSVDEILQNVVYIIADTLHSSAAYIEYIDGIRKELGKHGIDTCITLTDCNSENEIHQLDICEKLQVKGIIMISVIETPGLIDRLKRMQCPVILLSRYLKNYSLDSVILDNYKLGYTATARLIECGHKKIAHLAGMKTSIPSQERIRGYKDAMADAGLETDENSIFFGEHDYALGKKFAQTFCENQYTALFSAGDTMALGFIDAVYEMGYTCPKDISIICAENTSNLLSSKVKLTTIGYDNTIIGSAAAKLLLERIAHPASKVKTLSYPPEIVNRESIKIIVR